jgi:hypothetical protein
MADFDVFNGDADGICALLQLRLTDPRDATLVTGVKRDISLLKQVVAAEGDRVTALDISLDKNRDALNALLSAGASVFYADHHFPGEIPEHQNLTALIDTAPEVGTCALVNRHLNGAQAAWAVVGTYGDNLDQTAEAIAAAHGLDLDLPRCKELGVLINYNAYGATIDDLHIAPAALFKRLLAFSGPMDVLAGDPELVDRLSAGYDDDMKRAESSPRLLEDDNLAVIELPNEPWARRVSGGLWQSPRQLLSGSCPRNSYRYPRRLFSQRASTAQPPHGCRRGLSSVCHRRWACSGGGYQPAARR